MVKCASGGTVTVVAGGQALPEYRPVGWTEGNTSFKTCCELMNGAMIEWLYR